MAYHQKFAAYIGADFFRCGALYTHGTHEKMLSTYQKISLKEFAVKIEVCERMVIEEGVLELVQDV
ncbi:unnamed protein product [Brassica napus]|uniref:(rape) hypothetical protein n=1 Tax=Brassica napus TaxID=3708 RepID=A0A816I460_BRANA|nr:unnamed protein product [Brassica napus]